MENKNKLFPALKVFAVSVFAVGIIMLLFQSLRLDEAQSIWISSKTVAGIMNFTVTESHVPLYYLLLHFWMIIFGNNLIVGRLLSVIFFIITLPYLYLLSREEGNKDIGLNSVIFFITAPFVLWYATEIRMYSMFILSTTISHFYFLRFKRSNGSGAKFGLFLANLFGMYSHYFFLFNILSQVVYLIFFMNQNKRLLVLYLLNQIGVLFLFSPWLYYVIVSGQSLSSQPLLPVPSAFNLFQLFSLVIFGFQTNFVTGIIISLWPLMLIILFIIFTQNRIRLDNLKYFFMVTVLPVLSIFAVSIIIRPIFLPRYLIFITPSLFFLLSYLIASLPWNYRFPVTSVSVIILSLSVFTQIISDYNPDKINYRSAASYLSNQPTYSDIIAVSSPFTLYPLEYFYRGKAGLETIPNWDRYSQASIAPFSKADLTGQINNYKKTYTRLYAVFSYDQGYEKDIINFLDLNYRIEKITGFPGITIRVYRLRYDVVEKAFEFNPDKS